MKTLEQNYLESLNNNDYTEAKRLFNLIELEKREDFLMSLAFDSGSLVVYAFVCFLILEKEDAALHSLASVLLSHPLCFLDGAYSASLMHARKAVELDSTNAGYWEALLFFYHVPDTLISQQEALRIITSILKIDSYNACALEERKLILTHVQINTQLSIVSTSTFEDYIREGKYGCASKILEKIKKIEEQVLYLIEYGKTNPTLALYSFVLFSLFKKESTMMHLCAASILNNDLTFIVGAAESAELHLLRSQEITHIEKD